MLRLFQCVEDAINEVGLDGVTLDDVARRAGISRTTIYRKVGSRDDLLTAFLQHCFLGDITDLRQIAIGPGSFADRVEAVLVRSVLNVREHPWLQRQLERGMSPNSLNLIRESCRQISEMTLLELLQQGAAAGVWTSPAPLEELLHWASVQIFYHAVYEPEDVSEIRRIIRTYVLPVLKIGESAQDVGLADKIDAVYRHVVAMANGRAEQPAR